MLSIQDAGQQILNGNPGNFYIFGGVEYGVKDKYMSALKSHYGGLYTEAQDVQSIFDLMRTKQLIPLIPQLYIIRYDDAFLSGLKDRTSSDISKTNIVGTIVVIYQDSKAITKCDKFLSDYTVSFDTVAPTFVKKYLIQDYPELDTRLIDFSMKSRADYKGSQILCGMLNLIDRSAISRFDDSQLEAMFYGSTCSMDDHIKIGFASRNFKYLMQVLDIYPGDLDSLLYVLLGTLVDLDKLKVKNYIESPLKPYLGAWTKTDIYNMYLYVFEALEQLRSISSDVYSQIIYLFGVLQYQRIPAIGSLSWEDM